MSNSTHTKTETEKNCDKAGKALYKVISNFLYDKTMEILRDRVE